MGLRPLLGPLPAYNVPMLLNLALLGWAAFHLAHDLTGSWTAALLAGLVFAFNNYNVYELSHPVLADRVGHGQRLGLSLAGALSAPRRPGE